MTLTPFVDSLRVNNFDLFKEVIADFKNLKLDLKNQRRRVNQSMSIYTAYKGVKSITQDIIKVWNGRRIKDDKALELFKSAIRKINLLIQELRYFDGDRLASTFEGLLDKVISLLPTNTAVQLELFDTEKFTSKDKKPEKYLLYNFRRWRRDAIYREMQRIREAIFTDTTKLVFCQQLSFRLPMTA